MVIITNFLSISSLDVFVVLKQISLLCILHKMEIAALRRDSNFLIKFGRNVQPFSNIQLLIKTLLRWSEWLWHILYWHSWFNCHSFLLSCFCLTCFEGGIIPKVGKRRNQHPLSKFDRCRILGLCQADFSFRKYANCVNRNQSYIVINHGLGRASKDIEQEPEPEEEL